MPLTNSYNALAANNQQPEYQVLWEPMGIDPLSAAVVTYPVQSGSDLASGVGWVPGAFLVYNVGQTGVPASSQSGVGSYPPLGFGGTYPGGDSGGSGNPTFPNNWTVQQVDIAPISQTTQAAGILLGVGGLGLSAPAVPNTIPPVLAGSPSLVAMVGKRGITQVWVASSCTIGHTLEGATTTGYTGMLKDSGGTTATYGTTYGICLQTINSETYPQLCWAYINFP